MRRIQKPEAVSLRCFTKYIFQNFCVCVGVFFVIQLKDRSAVLFKKRIEFYEIFKNIYFIDYLKRNDSEKIYVIC